MGSNIGFNFIGIQQGIKASYCDTSKMKSYISFLLGKIELYK
jgi:hypothetical protein